MHRSCGHRRRGRKPTAAGGARSSARAVLSDTAPAREVIRPFFLPAVLCTDQTYHRRHPDDPQVQVLRNRPCSTAPAPHLALGGSFSTSVRCSKPPRLLLLLEVKLVHTVDSKSWFKHGRKWESCSMNLGLGSKRKRGKVVISVTV